MGSPLGYASDYFVRFIVAALSFLQPETVRYGLLAGIFGAGAFGMYLLARKHTSGWLAILIGFVAFINPAIFYKYTAGHFNYMVSLVLFIYLLYYLFNHFRPDLRSAVIVGLFFAFIGAQIQFFVITAMFMAVYFAFNRDKVRLKYLAVMILLPLLINAVWLANFVSGATSAAETGAIASKVSFKSLSGSDFLSIFTFSFAKATLLTKFYAFYELLWNTILFIFLLWLLVREKQKQNTDILLLVFLVIMIFMATGLFQLISVGPQTMLYPMLREVGHFAPVIVLVALLLIARLVHRSKWQWALLGVIVISLLTVGIKFQYFSQSYNFADVRQKFAPFKAVADRDTTDYRILAYPFFDQYSFLDFPKDPPNIMPLKNSGHDSFSAFSHQDYINNAVAPYKFQESLQYQLLQDYDIDVLRPYNVKYIFNFADIYESNYEKYVPPTVYNNDVSLIKNDDKFFDKLLERNPGKLRKVNNQVLEIKDYAPRIGTLSNIYDIDDATQAKQLGLFTREALQKPLDYTVREDAAKSYATKLTPLYNDPTKTKHDTKAGSFTQTLRPREGSSSKLYVDRARDTVLYESSGDTLTVYTQSTGKLLLNGQPLYAPGANRTVIAQIPTRPTTQYFVLFKGATTVVQPHSQGRLGMGTKGDRIEIFEASGQNIVSNGSFEQGLWQPKVNDCNNYDIEDNADLGMKQATMASDGSKSLELSARKHDACTFAELKLDTNSTYLLRYDYQSPNAKTSSFQLAFNNDRASLGKGSHTVINDKWNTYSKLVSTSQKSGNARLYLYALQQTDQNTVNRYDNVSMTKVRNVHSTQIPAITNPYETISLPVGNQEFTITDTGQTFENLVPNGSFEKGPWQKQVSDCRNYDRRAELSMGINTGDKTEGKQSLELSATRHDACVRTTTNITGDTTYNFAFDYKGQKGKYFGYAVSFDDPQNSLMRKQLEIKQAGEWQRANITVHAPARATTATVYLYAIEAGDKSGNVITYDNVSLTEQPDFANRFYVAETPKERLYTPASIKYDDRSASRKDITVTGASTPFFLTLSESYHPKWRLMLADSAIRGPIDSWSPKVAPTPAGEHMTVSNYMNGWLVDPQKLCEQAGAQLRDGCSKDNKGNYTIALVAEFEPQRWFIVATFISWVTLIACVVYVVASHGRELPTYRLPKYREWQQIIRRRR